jgi:hypothetical protein
MLGGHFAAILTPAFAVVRHADGLAERLGEAYLRSGKPAEAAVHYRKAIERGRKIPASPDSR